MRTIQATQERTETYRLIKLSRMPFSVSRLSWVVIVVDVWMKSS